MEHVHTIPEFITATLGFAVFLLGARLTRKVAFLREFNIPEPVTGGLLAAVLFGLFSYLTNSSIVFMMESRDVFLVVFFTGIGLNARLSDLVTGGKPLALLMILTLAIIVIQDIIGVAGAVLFDMPAQAGVLLGSASLIGGHGTAIAWAPEVTRITGMDSAAELGVTVATVGLVLAALVGGPVAKFLVNRYDLHSSHPNAENTVGAVYEDDAHPEPITHISLMRTLLVLNLAIIGGFLLHETLLDWGLMLPLFVPCLIMGIVLGNLHSILFPKVPAVSRTPTLAVVTDFALGVFLAISLMTLDLAALAGLGGPVFATIAVQAVVTVLFVIFVLFPVLGRGYRAAVLASGFAGFSLGATPTAIANMTAVTKRYGPSPIAFVVLPLVSAFFVDIANAIVIQTIVNF
ncbi:sodium/glutamate symporter [Halocynthiibacter sp. C4]|uniref:sodium/glutamate symporter n=1 Tax=Halocynthiibacter sp. C4 TaxID=2992758 RepID=UPI00237C4204|nr:sodium/glutamate symporter [Halocynthiibacter sp. C4]MDE0590116.1 sodium/glutamate symporter [Halocynthiibacter sp. C4]